MYNILYKTINLINNKYYIGIHRQLLPPYQFDGYYGSGKLLIHAIEKYGYENFIRKTLEVFDFYEQARNAERKMVDVNFLMKEDVYNISIGGNGGNTQPFRTENDKIKQTLKANASREITYLQNVADGLIDPGSGYKITDDLRIIYQNAAQQRVLDHPHTIPCNKGRVHKGNGLKNIQDAGKKRRGNNIWITNGQKTKMVSKLETIPNGWKNGRGADMPKFISHSEETKKKIANHPKIKGASCYTNGVKNIKIPKDQEIPEGFYKGVTFKKNRIINESSK